jgi:putative molybdopterin biosynthesis protein
MSLLKDDTTADAVPEVRSRVAEMRRLRGMAAAELARQAGVSRQTIYAIEAGSYVPNTAVALRLARALEAPVEDLFALDAPPPAAPPVAHARLIGDQGRFAGGSIELCRVGRRLVGVPAFPAPWQFTPADAMLLSPSRSTVRLLGGEIAGDHLLLAGCDPAASLLARHLRGSDVTLVNAPVNSSTALRLLRQGLVHVAGTHLHGGEGFPQRGAALAVFAFATWEEGFVVARGNPLEIRGAADLSRPGIRLVNREKGSGARQLLDRLLDAAGVPPASVHGYDEAAAGHLPAAWRVYSGLADCCVATRSAARAFGLDFLPLTSERYDLVVRTEHLALPAVQRLCDALAHSSLRRELEDLCGYDTHEAGRRIS